MAMDDLGLYLGKRTGAVYVDPAVTEGRPNAYAAYVSGDCLEPTFCDGDLILIDPDKKPHRGDYVLLGKLGWQPHAAELIENALSPLVRDSHNGTYRAPGETILGVIVCAVRPEAVVEGVA